MGNQKISIKDLSTIDFPSDVARSLGMNVMNKAFKHTPKEEKFRILRNVFEHPEEFLHDEALSILAGKLLGKLKDEAGHFAAYNLLDEPKAFEVFGHKHIESSAKQQMQLAMRLPVAAYGALLPDAHQGYGLPIGGVLATENAVIPYGVGMDIGCRMALSILSLPGSYVEHELYRLSKVLKANTHFGNEGSLETRQSHNILDHPDFMKTELLKRLHGKACMQLGSSGSGNHFVEFGIVELLEGNTLNVPAGTYAAILSHSGSRSLGANIAKHYTDIAMSRCKLPREVKHMAWLEMDSGEGQEYWLSMNLAGEYAKACHEQIHKNLTLEIGASVLATVDYHHNFAWKELIYGKEHIVHRKGATPASAGTLGIVPGSMTSPGYIVRGLGNTASLNSASHGAGRKMSRQKSKNFTSMSEVKKVVQAAKVTLIGGSTEEGPHSYKDIEMIIKSQHNLIAVEGKFYPRIVRMAKD
jgi:tRNA-splicing ligase RtcB (3'-phosphate/5'-hydroxy nucleic acid ligase)